ncbi:glycogen synthase [bacterium]|nr:glycogen synthase [bacterium]
MSSIPIIESNKVISPTKKLKILFVASEAAPFAKAGGLGDVMRSLPLSLKKLGQDARVMIPRYGTIDPQKYKLKAEIEKLKVPTDQPGPYAYLICNVKKYSNRENVTTYFLENMEYYEKRANVYGYSDDHVRWALLCRGIIEFLKKSSWKPDIIVASDWQTGLLPNYLKTVYKTDPYLSKLPVVFTIHNLEYQGMCDFKFTQESEKDSGRESIPDLFNPRLAKLNWMLRGIMYSDFIVTVSPTYAKEILTPEFGEGLDKILLEKQHRLFGILNGIDYQKYNPQTSSNIPVHYTQRSIDKKAESKIYLQKRLGLAEDQDAFLLAIVSRLTEQKGFDLLKDIIDSLFKNLPSLQLAIIGDGESRYKEMIQKKAKIFAKRIGYLFEFSHSLPHLVFAGADAVLLPSKFEPCGIVQMQAMRYGCIPIARKTGGLADTIQNFDPSKEKGNGFLFEEYNSMALYTAIVRAKTCFEFKGSWKKLIKKAMKIDFSWKKSAQEYLQLFYQIIKEVKK